MRVARLCLVAVAVTIGVGCGGDDGDDGVGPTPVFTSVSISPASPTVAIGATQQLTAIAKDQNGANLSGATFTYQSGALNIATVTNAGVVTGVAAGTARITATGTVGTVTKTAFVDVTVAVPGATATVTAAGTSFTPSNVTITVGGQVVWQFSGDHNVTFSTSGSPANIPTRSSGSESRTFPTAGEFAYICTIHGQNMNGTVKVQ